ncbi:hypothetical protein Rmet_6433 [Cupriavidus metallidurans CH34]|uniref:Uncharacterized protein n=1 Tax=Cupriavidus metallidurans (strain ATCC 43123 / DSM 2839 / NBRC 102507 / CH34) TaxID=266264 RepID=D3DXN0_CUPMC|nr:hypothetical protein Rmet_6433 [Cupriavidus metallidurans CH34]
MGAGAGPNVPPKSCDTSKMSAMLAKNTWTLPLLYASADIIAINQSPAVVPPPHGSCNLM